MKKNEAVIGVDLGGTNIRAALVSNGVITDSTTRTVPKTDNPDEVVGVIAESIRGVWSTGITGIGIGVPSVVDVKKGIVYDVENIPCWKEVHLKDQLEDQLHKPVYINNDANCFAAGERHFGSGMDYDDFVGLITGTGLGAGIIKDGRLLPDQNCGAGEFGIIPYLDHDCEYYCSGNFFSAEYDGNAKTMTERAVKADPVAMKAFEAYGRHLGVTVKTIMACLDPAAIIIGGGVSKAFDLYEAAMLREVATFPYGKAAERIRIMPSKLDNVAILGAAALCFDAMAQPDSVPD